MSSRPLHRGPRRARRTAALALLVGLGVGVGASARPAAAVFSDATAASRITASHGYRDGSGYLADDTTSAGGVGAGDFDGDGLVDLCLVRGDLGLPVLYRNRGKGVFADVTASAGLAAAIPSGRWSNATFADIDGDGWLDLLLLGIRDTPPLLFHNEGSGTFALVEDSGIAMPQNSYSASFGDFDRDGDLDLFVAHWLSSVTPSLPGYLWRNDGTGHFTDVSLAAGLPVLSGRTFGYDDYPLLDVSYTGNFADIDSDGWPDLLVAADFGGSRIFRNEGDGTFSQVYSGGLPDDENGMGSAIGDFDDDGDLDWFVTSIWDPDGRASGYWGVTGNRLYENDGSGRFAEVSAAAGVREGWWAWAASFADFDADGHLDIVHANGWGYYPQAGEFLADPLRIFLSDGDGTFTESSAALGAVVTDNNRGLVVFDLERDGDLDFLVTNNEGMPRLLRNDGPTGRLLAVRVRPLGGNTEGIGVRVRARIGATTQMRELRAGSNYSSQDPAEALFGLGAADAVDELRVDWPDGTQTVLADVAAGNVVVAQPVAGAPDCTDAAPVNGCVHGARATSQATSPTECLLEWRVEAAGQPLDDSGNPPATVACTDGDPACDTGPTEGSCLFEVAACVNNADPRVPACAPGEPARIEIRSPKRTSRLSWERDAHRALDRALGALGLQSTLFRGTAADDCRPVQVEVPLRATATGVLRAAKLKLDAKLVLADRRNDSDKITLVCNPAP